MGRRGEAHDLGGACVKDTQAGHAEAPGISGKAMMMVAEAKPGRAAAVTHAG